MMQMECGMRLTDNPFSHSPTTADHRQLPQQPSSFSCPTHIMALPHPLCRSPPSPSLISLNTIIQTDTCTQPGRFSEENIDVNLPSLIAVLKSVGDGECWNKHGSLLDYLFDTYRILKLWGAPDADILFDNTVGMMKFSGNSYSTGLRPGDGKPRLWMNSISRMGAVHTLIMWEEQICSIEQSQSANINSQDEEIELEGVCNASKKGLDWSEEVLQMSEEKNPFVGEPHVVSGQI
uniref:Uncharacterized protein n=1 Tax=Tanacetum cinerariifolium TaxID=118510 RepID=A0A6L2JPP8_TANCI|nr:hypothetical protein [Tanacetum cinerariifolium]